MQLTLCQCELKMQNIIFLLHREKRTLIQIFNDLGKWKIKIASVITDEKSVFFSCL